MLDAGPSFYGSAQGYVQRRGNQFTSYALAGIGTSHKSRFFWAYSEIRLCHGPEGRHSRECESHTTVCLGMVVMEGVPHFAAAEWCNS